ncbi:hypothetical protein ACFX1R_018268 [Malus domestica]
MGWMEPDNLFRLWIAEEFVEPNDGVTPEEVAEDYLTEFTARSMLQIMQTNEDGRAKTCKMHDLTPENLILLLVCQSFGCFLPIFATNMLYEFKKLPSRFKLLTILDLEDVPVARVPNELVHLSDLRYLNLKDTLIEQLPESIEWMCKLEALNIP